MNAFMNACMHACTHVCMHVCMQVLHVFLHFSAAFAAISTFLVSRSIFWRSFGSWGLHLRHFISLFHVHATMWCVCVRTCVRARELAGMPREASCKQLELVTGECSYKQRNQRLVASPLGPKLFFTVFTNTTLRVATRFK